MTRTPRAVLACEKLRGPPSAIPARERPAIRSSPLDGPAKAGWICLLAAALLACAPDQGSLTPARPPPDAERPAGPNEAEPSRPEAPLLELGSDARHEGEIEAGEIHRFHLTLEVGRTTRLLARRRAADLSLTLRDASGTAILGVNLVDDREIGLDLIPAETGRHSLELKAFSNSATGSYRLAMDDSRPTTERDRRRAAMERLFAGAEALRSRRDRESCERAVALDLEALGIARELGDVRRQADILDHLGWIHRRFLEDLRTALEHYRRSLALFEQLADPRRQEDVLVYLGRCHFDLGELEAAIAVWERALPLAQRVGDVGGEAAILANLALAARYLGDSRRALEYLDRSLEVHERLDVRRDLGRALNNRGRLYRNLGENRQALADLEKALGIAREFGEEQLEAITRTAIGGLLEEEGRLEEARLQLEEALELRIGSGAERGRGVTLRALGSVQEKLGSVEAALGSYRQALELFQRVEAPRDAASTLVALGRLGLDRGGTSEAADRLYQALSSFRGIGDPHGEIRTLDSLARAERDLGRPRRALEHLADAIETVERVRRHAPGPHLRATYLASQQGRYDSYIEVAMDLHRQQPEAGYSVAAFEASERARARALLDRLSAQRVARNAETDPHLLSREREIEQSLRLVQAERLRLLDRGGGPSRLRTLEARLDELLREHRAVRARLEADGPDVAGGQMADGPGALDLEALRRQVLDAETLLLQYRLGPRRSYAWAVDLEGISVHELPSRAELEAAARRAYELIEVSHLRETRATASLALERLGRLLLDPLAGRLGERRLVVAGDGALLYIPFAALPTAGADAEPLLLRHEIVVLPSASTVALQRRKRVGRKPAPGTIALLADPVFDRSDPRLAKEAGPGSESADSPGILLRRLPFTGQEAEAIAALADPSETFLALGVEASREAVSKPELGRYRILHLATHAELDAERPELSRLVFSRFDAQGRPTEPHLFAHELHELRLPAELVVLSACSSALGKELRGEGLVGLTQGFFAAGAARVVVSLWPVEDRATAALMQELYRSMWVDGLPPAAALRQAQLTIRSRPGWRAPYYWAGFVLQGEWR